MPEQPSITEIILRTIRSQAKDQSLLLDVLSLVDQLLGADYMAVYYRAKYFEYYCPVYYKIVHAKLTAKEHYIEREEDAYAFVLSNNLKEKDYSLEEFQRRIRKGLPMSGYIVTKVINKREDSANN